MATRHPPTLSEALRMHRSPWNPTDHKTNVFYQLVKAFYNPTFRFHLPRISQSGLRTCIDDIAEVEKLEFLGDGAIGDSVGDIVTQLRPNGSPHIYTVRQHPGYMNQWLWNLTRPSLEASQANPYMQRLLCAADVQIWCC